MSFNKKSKLLLYLVFGSLIWLVGCLRATQPSVAPVSTTAPAATLTVKSVYLATPAASEIAAGICAEPEAEVVQVTIYPDIPDPRCLKVKPEQKLKVVNQAQAKLEISLGEFMAELQPGEEVLWDAAFGEYLEPGVHLLGVQPCCGPEIWLQK